MTDKNNVSEIDKKLQDPETVFSKFTNAHKALHKNLHDKDDIEESNDYFDIEQERITNLRQRVHE